MTESNKNELFNAVKSLDDFMKSWCMDDEKTKAEGEPVFRCSECPFMVGKFCTVKFFKTLKMPEYENFGCMIR